MFGTTRDVAARGPRVTRERRDDARRRDDPARRPRRVLRVGRAARRPGAARPAGRRRRARQPGRRARRELRGAAVRRALGDADGAGAPACPHAVFLSPRFERYVGEEPRGHGDPRVVTPLVEQLSLDEAFLDVARRAPAARHRRARSRRCIRRRVRAETGLIASVGVATTKFLAKLASDLAKPDGLLVSRRAPSSSSSRRCRSRGCGASARRRCRKLERIGVRTIGDVAALPRSGRSSARSGRRSARTCTRSRGTTTTATVVPDRETKSIGAEETFAADLHTDARVRARARPAGRPRRRAAARRGARRRARSRSRSASATSRRAPGRARLPEPTDVSTRRRSTTARELLDGLRRRPRRPAARRVAVAARATRPRSSSDARRSTTTRARRRRARSSSRAAVERAIDAVRDRFGDDAVGPAALVDATSADGDDDPDRARRLRPHRHRALVRAPAARRRRARRRRLDRDLRHRPASAPRRWPRHHGGEPARDARRAGRRGRRGVGLHVDRRPPRGGRGGGRRGPCRLLREAARARPRAAASASRRCSSGCRTRSGWCCAGRRCSQRAAEIVAAGELRPADRDRRCATTSTSRSRACTARPGATTSRTRAAARSSSTRSTTSTCCAGSSAIPSRSTRAHRVALRARRHRGHRGGDVRATPTARSRSSRASGTRCCRRESSRRLEVFCEEALLWTDDDYLGPAPRRDHDGTSEIVERPLPEWIDRLTVARGLRQAARAVRRADQGVPRRASARRRATTPVGHPRRGEALAAHRLVDGAYRSAAAGGDADTGRRAPTMSDAAVGTHRGMLAPPRVVGPCWAPRQWPSLEALARSARSRRARFDEGTVMPLSEEEQKILKEIEAQLNATDPGLVEQVSRTTLYRHAARMIRWAALGFLAGLVLLVFTFADERLRRRRRVPGDARLPARHRAQRPQARQGRDADPHRRLAGRRRAARALRRARAAPGASASAATTPDRGWATRPRRRRGSRGCTVSQLRLLGRAAGSSSERTDRRAARTRLP